MLMALPSWAQEIDVAQVLADTKTFIFDNGENTVKGYVYAVLENETNCCGEDRIYLEVKIDPSGYVISAKPLTGSNECFRLSAVDIVKNIRWDAEEFKGPKSVYFEIKPNVECTDGRDNEYVAIETFNNEILAPGSTTSEGETAPQVAATEEEPVEADPEQLEDLINVTSGEAEGEEEPAEAAGKEEVATAEADPVEEPFEGVVTEEPAPRPADPPVAEAEPETKEVRNVTRSEVAPSEAAEAERVAQQQELQQLRGQLEQLRAEEEKRRRELAAREEARRRQEEAERTRQEAEQETYAASEEGEQGGLWLPGSEEETAMAEEEGTFGDGGMGSMSEEDRLREEIERLRQERVELEQAKRQREQEVMQAIENTRRDNEQILRLEEEIAARQEEAARVREEMELRRLEEERMRVDEARQREEEEYQRMMDEIARLQAEAEAQIANLEAQKAELDRMTELRKKREQEIALERAIREKERKKRMEEVRLGIMSDGIPITSLDEQGQNLEGMMADIDLSAEADSEALQILIQQIQQMKLEMARLQQQIRDLGGEPATPSMSSSSSSYATRGSDYSYGGGDGQGTVRGGGDGGDDDKGSTNGGGGNGNKEKSGAEDTSWRNIDYRDPNADPSLYPNRPAPTPTPTESPRPATQPQTQPQAADNGSDSEQSTPQEVSTRFDPRRGYTNNLDSEHDNLPGPKASVRDYIAGRDAMKDKIKADLKAGGVCGLAQALFSVTLDPQGNVVDYDVLGANSEAVELQLMTVLPTLQFQPAQVNYNQELYLEFKAEIVCEGGDRVNLRNVNPILETGNQ